MMTTPVEAFFGQNKESGTGFFYEPRESDIGEGWKPVDKIWLIVNRHIVLRRDGENESLPDKIKFNLKRILSNSITWIPIEISKDEFIKRAKFHPNHLVDVAIIEILDLLKNVIIDAPVDKKTHSTNVMNFQGVSKAMLPGKNKISVEVADDVIVIGYPHGFYDTHNAFPVVKSGIIASKWGAHFNNMPYFHIDARLFPGSSGSLVLSKPKDVIIENGQVFTSQEKQCAFLGIYSANTIIDILDDDNKVVEHDINLGVVWYGFLIDEIIQDGISATDAIK